MIHFVPKCRQGGSASITAQPCSGFASRHNDLHFPPRTEFPISQAYFSAVRMLFFPPRTKHHSHFALPAAEAIAKATPGSEGSCSCGAAVQGPGAPLPTWGWRAPPVLCCNHCEHQALQFLGCSLTYSGGSDITLRLSTHIRVHLKMPKGNGALAA